MVLISTYLAYAFSNNAAQNSFGSELLVNSNFPVNRMLLIDKTCKTYMVTIVRVCYIRSSDKWETMSRPIFELKYSHLHFSCTIRLKIFVIRSIVS